MTFLITLPVEDFGRTWLACCGIQVVEVGLFGRPGLKNVSFAIPPGRSMPCAGDLGAQGWGLPGAGGASGETMEDQL
jgi:hypothetical protein